MSMCYLFKDIALLYICMPLLRAQRLRSIHPLWHAVTAVHLEHEL